ARRSEALDGKPLNGARRRQAGPDRGEVESQTLAREGGFVRQRHAPRGRGRRSPADVEGQAIEEADTLRIDLVARRLVATVEDGVDSEGVIAAGIAVGEADAGS